MSLGVELPTMLRADSAWVGYAPGAARKHRLGGVRITASSARAGPAACVYPAPSADGSRGNAKPCGEFKLGQGGAGGAGAHSKQRYRSAGGRNRRHRDRSHRGASGTPARPAIRRSVRPLSAASAA